jgi:light-regulated signal transduction histidine kinase (bacteriophytochrome)
MIASTHDSEGQIPDQRRPPGDESGATMMNTTACEDEPIRIPGSIQRHGFLLLLDERAKRVVGASENVEEMLGVPWKLIVGTPVETILEREVLAALRAPGLDEEQPGTVTYLGSFPVRHELYSVVTHRTGSRRALEFECIDRLVRPELMNVVITNFVGQLSKLRTEDELCRAITKQVLDLTGVNRVLLYSFNEAGHGTVLAEESDGTLPSYLGLRFPDGDIPKQARELYLLNTVRLIPNSTYIPSPLRTLSSEEGTPVDLSMAILRSVSPIHLEYMRNMGTAASMSISIVCEGRLWGLISCHHATPRSVPFLVRSACDLLTKLVGTLLTGLRTTDRLVKMVHFHAVQRRILTQMAAENDYVAAMRAQMTSMAEVTDAAGVVLIVDGVCEVAGETPALADVLRLADWMNQVPDMELYQSRELGVELGWADAIRGVASGMLAIRISNVKQSYVIWFRPELVRAVSWAGEPGSPSREKRGLEPRTSFDAWKVLVRGQSEPWSDMEIESAREFRAAVMTINLKRAEEAVQLSESRFKQLTHALPNLVWTANDDGLLSYVNERWRDQGLGDEGRWFEGGRVVEEDLGRCVELWDEAIRQGKAFEAEVRLCCGPDHAKRWNLVRAAPFLRANGMRAGWVGTCTDLTDRYERELALKLTEKLALTGRMTSVIAHEINNPLEAITNLLYLLRDEVDGKGPAKSYIAMAESELQRISGITKQTLRWSRDGIQKAEHGTAALLFNDVLKLLAGKIRNREVSVRVSGNDTPVFGVITQLQQVLANLVSNAVDAVPLGGRVWLSAGPSGSGVEIEVADEGSGMNEETLRKIFQPFYSTKGDLGNGLGLYISQEIVERHRGQLTVTSDVGLGTRVRIQLPRQLPQSNSLLPGN